MYSLGLALTLRPGAYEKYKLAHDEIWPGLTAGMRANQVSMAIYRDGDRLFHQACARDSWGHSDLAVPLYARALELGSLTGENRRRAVIQMSSSMRNVGRAQEALANLVAEQENGKDHLSDALDCTIALCLSTLGRDREGLSLVMTALARHLPRYNRSMANYARLLGE